MYGMITSLEEKALQEWEKLGISNDFVFCKVMQEEENLGELILLVLPFPRISRMHI